MSSLREIKERITSVNSTLKITSAMKMVASAKLHKAQLAIENMLPYEQKLHGILTDLMASRIGDSSGDGDAAGGDFASLQDDAAEKYMTARPVGKVALVAWSSNSSLCGAFNANAIRHASETIAALVSSGLKPSDITVYSVGKKMDDAMRKMGYPSPADFSTLSEKPSYQGAAALAEMLAEGFLSGKYDKVTLIYNHYKSTSSQPTVEEVYLPFAVGDKASGAGASASGGEAAAVGAETMSAGDEAMARAGSAGKVGGALRADYIVEPNAEEIIAELLPKALRLKIYTVQLDTSAAEHAARTVAMQTATDNGNDILQDLTLEYNKGRQQKITSEILDIVGGSMQ